jgi:hypothetical protein
MSLLIWNGFWNSIWVRVGPTRDSLVGTVTRPRAGRPTNRGTISVRGRDYSLLLRLHTDSGAHPFSYPVSTWGPFPRRWNDRVVKCVLLFLLTCLWRLAYLTTGTTSPLTVHRNYSIYAQSNNRLRIIIYVKLTQYWYRICTILHNIWFNLFYWLLASEMLRLDLCLASLIFPHRF